MLWQAPLREFKEQELSNTLWAVSSLGLADTQIPALFTQEALARGLHAFSAQGVANYMWACACLGYRDDNFMHVRLLCYPLLVAKCMWACLAWLAWRCASPAPTGAWQGKARRVRMQQTLRRSLRRLACTDKFSADLHSSYVNLKPCPPLAIAGGKRTPAAAHGALHAAGRVQLHLGMLRAGLLQPGAL